MTADLIRRIGEYSAVDRAVCDNGEGQDPNAPGERVTRGGDHVFDVAPGQLTGYFRDGFSRNPRRGHRHIGFRCAKDAV